MYPLWLFCITLFGIPTTQSQVVYLSPGKTGSTQVILKTGSTQVILKTGSIQVILKTGSIQVILKTGSTQVILKNNKNI